MTKPQYTTVYKVCKKVDGELYSLYHSDLDGISVKYQVGKATRPRVGLLFAFTTKKDALSFCSPRRRNSVLYLARAVVKKVFPSMDEGVLCPSSYRSQKSLAEASRRWWKCMMTEEDIYKEGLILGWRCTRPFAACSSITLLEEITR